MSGLGFATAVLLASLALTYFFCLRPMRQNKCMMAGKARPSDQAKPAAGREDEAARLREEIAALRAAGLGQKSG